MESEIRYCITIIYKSGAIDNFGMPLEKCEEVMKAFKATEENLFLYMPNAMLNKTAISILKIQRYKYFKGMATNTITPVNLLIEE